VISSEHEFHTFQHYSTLKQTERKRNYSNALFPPFCKKLFGFHFMYIFDNPVNKNCRESPKYFLQCTVLYLRLTGLRESKLVAVLLPLGGCDPDDNTRPVSRRQAVDMAPVLELAPAGTQPHCPGHLKALPQQFFL
jgi:hypothetical protein